MTNKGPKVCRAKSVVVFFVLLCCTGTAWAATYYIDYNATDDSANGTAKGTPWKRQPYMQGFGGSYSHSAGDKFIFKGGVTWPAACFAYGTAPAGPIISDGGTSGNSDYYGVDKTWYTGAAWSRPIFSNSGTSSNAFFWIMANNITFDNIEFTGTHWTTSGTQVFFLYLTSSTDILIENCYFHGWSHSVGAEDDLDILRSVFNTDVSTQVVNKCVFDGTDSTNGGDSGRAWYGGGVMTNCTIKNMPNGFLASSSTTATAQGNNIGPITESFGGSHANAIQDVGVRGTFYIIGNYIHDVIVGEVMFVGGFNNTIYIYNNVVWNTAVGGPPPIEIELRDDAVAAVYIMNNVLDGSHGNAPCIVFDMTTVAVPIFVNQNNQFIGKGIRNSPLSIANLSESNNLFQSPAEATAAGYTAANLYKPPSVSGVTVGAGISKSSIFSTDILGSARPNDVGWDIGAYQYHNGEPVLNAPSGLRLKQ